MNILCEMNRTAYENAYKLLKGMSQSDRGLAYWSAQDYYDKIRTEQRDMYNRPWAYENGGSWDLSELVRADQTITAYHDIATEEREARQKIFS